MTKMLPLGALALSLLLTGPASAPAAGKGPIGTKADFRLKTLDGKMLGPKDFPGQVVVIDFWATWCGPCQIQAKILEPVYRDHKGRGVQFLAANVGEDVDTVKKFVQGKPFPYPVVLDPDDKVASNLGVLALPTLIVVDKKGKITKVHSGLADGDTIRKAIKAAS
ncbi:MAG TPA: TlpA disulfide reductase family protein [Thermoanaerobaculia bacterium]|nr:TlpA disulfide reductase family protein [Thermoanaerobaculia bacterium]